jgi:hypothetical protein
MTFVNYYDSKPQFFYSEETATYFLIKLCLWLFPSVYPFIYPLCLSTIWMATVSNPLAPESNIWWELQKNRI